MTIQQISVFLENRAGELSRVVSVLAENNIDLRAINIAETADYGVLRLIAADSQQATSVLLENGFVLSAAPVVAALVPDEPGGLAKLLKLAAAAGLDIQYMYSVFSGKAGSACMVFRVADMEKLSEIFESGGIELVGDEALGN